MKVSKKGYKKNSKYKNEPALMVPSSEITMKEDNGEPLKKGRILGIDNLGNMTIMEPGLDYSFPGSYVYELPMAKNGMSAPGLSKVIGGKLEISYDKDRNVYLRTLDSDTWTKIEGDQAKEFRTKFAQYMPGYFDPAGSIKQISKKAAKQVGAKQQIVDDKPKYQEVPQEVEPAQEVAQAPQSPLQQVAAGVPPMLARSAAQPTFGDKILSEIGNPEKIRQTKLQSKYQTSPDYHVTPYASVAIANKEYEKTIDYKLRHKNINDYSTEDIPKIQEKLYNEGYLQKPEQLDISAYKSKDQVIELQKKLAKFGLMDMLGKGGPNKDGITGTLTKETKDAVKRFNELNKTYKPGELDDMTKQAIKDFKNSTDSKNAMGLPVVNPKELYDPETGEPYTDKTYEAMSVFENSLKSKGYFLGDQGYDISESVAANPKISFNFKLNPEPTTAFGMCAAYVNGTVCEDDVVGEEARDELGFKGSAWHISENLQDKGGQLVFSGLPDRSAVNLNGKNEITDYLKSRLTSPESKTQLKYLIGEGNLWGENTKIKPGDVVNIFYEGSSYTEEAYNQTKSLNNRFFTTHVGIVKADDRGNLYVEHNIHGKVEKDKIQDFLDGKVKGNGKNKVSLISGITRPKYVDGVDKDARIPVTGLSYYQTEEGKFNPRGVFANPGDFLAQSISGENTHKYLTTIEKNKNKLLKDIPISETEFGKLMRVARVIPTLETYAGQNAEEEQTIAYQIEKGLKDIVSEKSTGFTKLKDASNLGEDLRQNLYQNDDSQLTNPVKAAIPTFYLLSKNYLYLKEVANRNNIDITSDELAKLAGLSYNQSIGKIAGELVDKGSYQNYYNYRVKTATDPGGQFKYRKVMDLYDTQTMKEGGITAPGRFRNPEGNWLNKYQTRGEVRTSVDPETGVVTNINITDEPPFQWTPLEDQYGIKPSAQKRTDYLPYKDVSGAPYETQDPYIHNFSTVDVPENLSELPSYRMYTYGKNQVYSPFSGHISRAKPNAKPINEYGDIDSKDLEDQQLYDQHTYRNFDPKTGYNYELNQENLQPFQSIPMEGDKGFNLRRFVLNPYEGDPQTEDLYIRKDKDGMQLWDGEEKVVKDKENFIPKSYSREETMDNVFKDLYAQNLYKFKGDRDAAYNATSKFMTERVEPQYKGKYYEYINNPNVSERDKLNINLVGSHMTVNPEQTEDYVRQTIADKLAEEHPEYLTNEDLDFDKAIKSDPRYREKLNEYNEVLQDWYVTNKNMSPEEAKALVEKDLYKNVPKRKTIYATFKKGGWLDKYQDKGEVKTTFKDWGTGVPKPTPPIRNPLSEADLRKGYTWSPELGVIAPQVEITAERPYDLVSVPGGHGSMVTAKRYKNNNLSYSPETIGAMNASNQIARSNNLDPITLGFAAGAAPISATAARLAPAISGALNAPLTIGSTVIPGATAGNALGAMGAADALVNRFPQIPGQLGRGEYLDAAVNAGTGVLDLSGANMVSPLFKGARSAAKTAKNLTTQIPSKGPGPLMLFGNLADKGADTSKGLNLEIVPENIRNLRGPDAYRIKKNNEWIGDFDFEQSKSGDWTIGNVSLNKEHRGKGLGKEAFIQANNLLKNQGRGSLHSSGNFYGNDAKRVWESLVKEGKAEKIGPDAWRFIDTPSKQPDTSMIPTTYQGNYYNLLDDLKAKPLTEEEFATLRKNYGAKQINTTGNQQFLDEQLRRFTEGTDFAKRWAYSPEKLKSFDDQVIQKSKEISETYDPMITDLNNKIQSLDDQIEDLIQNGKRTEDGLLVDNQLLFDLSHKRQIFDGNRWNMFLTKNGEIEGMKKKLFDETGIFDKDFAEKIKNIESAAGYKPSEQLNPHYFKNKDVLVHVDLNNPESDPGFRSLSDSDKMKILKGYENFHGIRTGDATITLGSIPGETRYAVQEKPKNWKNPMEWFKKPEKTLLEITGPSYRSPLGVGETAAHEVGHDLQQVNEWINNLREYNDTFKYYTGHEKNPLAKRFKDAMVEPTLPGADGKSTYETWLSAQSELHSELMKARLILARDLMDSGDMSMEQAIKHLKKHGDNDLLIDDLIQKGNLNKHFKPSTTQQEKRALIKMLPAVIPAVGVAGALQKEKDGGWLDRYQDGSQVEPSGKEMAEDLKRIWNLKDPSFTRPSNYGEYIPKFGWSRGSMTPEERAYEQEYQDWRYSQIPQSWKNRYDWTPNVEKEYLQFKNDPSAPENLRFTDDMKDYNTRGMWDSLDRPSNWQQALDLFRQQQGYDWTPEDDGYYHAWSQHPGTGEWLKPKHHSTGWMNYMGYAFDPNTTAVVNPEGFFGNETLQAYPRKKNGGIKSSGEGYYDYINGYSGIFAKGGPKGWLDNYK